MNPGRRALLGAAVGWWATGVLPVRAAGTAAGAAAGADVKPRLPFIPVGPFADDSNTAFAFFLFTCPFCREHMAAIASWGQTLPAPLRFGSSPIPEGQAGLEGARAFYAVRRAAPTKLADYEYAVYAALHDARENPDDEQTYFKAATGIGIPATTLTKWWRHDEVKRDVVLAKVRLDRYAIDQTPAIAIGGRYVLYADLVNGDYPMMIKLANGIISQMLPRSSTGVR